MPSELHTRDETVFHASMKPGQGTERIIRQHEDSVDSTLDCARKLVNDACPPWTLVTTDYQVNGRGTRGRNWFAPHGTALLMSLVVPPPKALSDMDLLTVRTADILATVFGDLCDLQAVVKHPNDVLVNGSKCAGILFESVIRRGVMVSLILGMGVNVHQTEGDFRTELLTEATSLAMESDRPCDRESVRTLFLERFIVMYDMLYGSGGNGDTTV